MANFLQTSSRIACCPSKRRGCPLTAHRLPLLLTGQTAVTQILSMPLLLAICYLAVEDQTPVTPVVGSKFSLIKIGHPLQYTIIFPMSDHVSQNVIIWALLSTVTSCIFLDTPACHNWGVEVSPQFWHCGDFETHYISTEPNLSKVLIHTQAKGAWPFKGSRLVLRKSSSTAETNAMFAPRLISKVTCSQISEKYRIQSNIRKV